MPIVQTRKLKHCLSDYPYLKIMHLLIQSPFELFSSDGIADACTELLGGVLADTAEATETLSGNGMGLLAEVLMGRSVVSDDGSEEAVREDVWLPASVMAGEEPGTTETGNTSCTTSCVSLSVEELRSTTFCMGVGNSLEGTSPVHNERVRIKNWQ